MVCRIYSLFFSFFVIVAFASPLWSQQKTYRVVIDPGHGGKQLNPNSVYGDRWDSISQSYLNAFGTGASFREMNEFEEAYEIAKLAKEYLDLLKTKDGRKIFLRILQKYSHNTKMIKGQIEAYMSRPPNYYDKYNQEDPNADYRLFDYPHIRTEQMQKGTISTINSLQPHLVVSIHFTKGGAPSETGGLAAVVTPSYYTFREAIDYANASKNERAIIRKRFASSAYRNWFLSGIDRRHFEWFLSDASIYFTGYRSKINGLSPQLKSFYGYRHNMISWVYRDAPGWEAKAKLHRSNSSYSRYLKHFKPQGKFWQREKSKPEYWRREKGTEGYGGDNLYAANEILRYVRQSLLINKKKSYKNLPVLLPPYLSTWALPTYVNAISAYLELAYINKEVDYQRVIKMKKEMAEAIAVGIYSLFYSLEQSSDNRQKQLPLGKAIDFARYENYQGGSYFEKVLQD